MATTYSTSATYARFALLAMQVRALLREAAGASDRAVEQVSVGLRQPHYIREVVVRGMLPNGTIAAALRITIDWRIHALEVSAGASQISLPHSWRSDVAPSLQEAISTFNEAVSYARLGVEWVVLYEPHFNAADVDRILGFGPAPSRTWHREPDEASFGLGPLGEGSIVVQLAID